MNLPLRQGKRAKSKTSFFLVFYVGHLPELWARFRVGLATSNDVLKKISSSVSSCLGFQFIPDVIKLITNIRHHNHLMYHFGILLKTVCRESDLCCTLVVFLALKNIFAEALSFRGSDGTRVRTDVV